MHLLLAAISAITFSVGSVAQTSAPGDSCGKSTSDRCCSVSKANLGDRNSRDGVYIAHKSVYAGMNGRFPKFDVSEYNDSFWYQCISLTGYSAMHMDGTVKAEDLEKIAKVYGCLATCSEETLKKYPAVPPVACGGRDSYDSHCFKISNTGKISLTGDEKSFKKNGAGLYTEIECNETSKEGKVDRRAGKWLLKHLSGRPVELREARSAFVSQTYEYDKSGNCFETRRATVAVDGSEPSPTPSDHAGSAKKQ